MWLGEAESPDKAMEEMIDVIFIKCREELGCGVSGIIESIDKCLGRISDYNVYQCHVTINQFNSLLDDSNLDVEKLRPYFKNYIDPYE